MYKKRHSTGATASASAIALKESLSISRKLNLDNAKQQYGSVRTLPLKHVLPPTLLTLFLLLAVLMSLTWGVRLGQMKELAVRETAQTALSLAEKLESTTSIRAVSRVSQWYEANYRAFAVLSHTFKAGIMGRSNFDHVYWYFLATVQENPTMTGLVLADSEKSAFLAISRMDNGSYTFELQATPSSGLSCVICPTLNIPPSEKWYYMIDPTSNRPHSTPYLRASYAMTSRPWYTTPINANKMTWCDFYSRSNGLMSQMNLGQPMYPSNRSGVPWGVISLEASTQPITTILKSGVADMPATTAYAMDSKYRLMGTSANETAYVNQAQIAAVNSTDDFTATTAPAVVAMLRTGGGSQVIRGTQYWFTFARYMGQAGAQAIVVAGTPSIEYTSALDQVETGFESSFTQSLRDAAVHAGAFALLCAALAVVVLHQTVIRPLKDVCTEMVLATNLEFQALVDGAHTMCPSRVRELNKMQYSFRALVAEFAIGLCESSKAASQRNQISKTGSGNAGQQQSASVVNALFTRSSMGITPARGLVGNTRTLASSHLERGREMAQSRFAPLTD